MEISVLFARSFCLLGVTLLSLGFISCDVQLLKHSGDLASPFRSDFLFGTASSAYQHEGAYLEKGKGLNNWDAFTHKHPEDMKDGNNGDVAADHYHRYEEDIDLMARLEVNSYRFSISWARILPKGRFGPINYAGIRHYNRVIDALLRKGIRPFITLSHLDFPQELEDQYGSWLSRESQKDFAYYADICFKHFGDRVKHWVTFNEPNFQVSFGYRDGSYPPNRCSAPFGNCSRGNSIAEPFIAAHNIILAHADAVDIYRRKYEETQKGSVGIVLHCKWFEPISNSSADKLAAERAQSFFMNWFLDPIIFGRYPKEMQTILGTLLPRFSANDLNKLRKGLDFIGINHYTSSYVKDCLYSPCTTGSGASRTEGFALTTQHRNNVPLGAPSEVSWLYVYPQGMQKIVNYVKNRYNNIPMFITENGYPDLSKPNDILQELNDWKRVEYMAGYLESLKDAIREGADVRGYFTWSVLDNFEWLFGYTVRFGLYHVDRSTLKRTPKLSAEWYRSFIVNNTLTKPQEQ